MHKNGLLLMFMFGWQQVSCRLYTEGEEISSNVSGEINALVICLDRKGSLRLFLMSIYN